MLAIVAVAGCGGGSSESAPAAAAPGRAEYVKRVDQICARYATRVTKASQHFEAVEHRAGASGEFAAVAGAYRDAARRLDRVTRRIRAVPPPSVDRETIDAWLAASEDQADDRRALADALDDRRPANAITVLQDRLRRDRAIADEAIAGYGFRDCGP